MTTERPWLEPLWLMIRSSIIRYLVLILLTWSESASAGGFRIYDQSASATGQSAAFAAQADDPSAIYYNPAGMTQLRGTQLSFGTLLIGGHTSFTSPSGATAHGDFGGSIAYPPPSNFYATVNFKDAGYQAFGNLSAGVAVLSPFGNMYRYGNNGPFATAVIRSALQLIDIKPTLAYKLTDQFSIGLGADIYTFFNFWGQGQYETHLNSSGGPPLPPPGTPLELNGRGTTAGFNASLLYTPLRTADKKPLVNVALLYRSQAALPIKGQFLANGTVVSDARTTLVLPQIFTGGLAVWPIQDDRHAWKLEVDVDYTDWHSMRNTDVQLSNGVTIPFAQNWRSTYTVLLGTEYRWLDLQQLPNWEVALRGGYWHSMTPVPDSSFNPQLPDADNHSISAGLGFLCKRNGHFLGLFECGHVGRGLLNPQALGLDLAYQALIYEPRTVTGNLNPVAIPGSVNGVYHTVFHSGSINLRVNF
jgi:long-chain fatty acid transport protein